jgi:hypothetical protein
MKSLVIHQHLEPLVMQSPDQQPKTRHQHKETLFMELAMVEALMRPAMQREPTQ